MSSTTTSDELAVKHYRPRRIVVTALVFIIVAASSVVAGILLGRKKETNAVASTQTEVDNLLPFLQVDVLQETEAEVMGTMSVSEDHEKFTFQSIRTADNAVLKFECDKDVAAKSDEMDGWCGLEMAKVGEGSKVIVLSRYDGANSSIIDISEADKELDETEIHTMESFVGSKLAEYYVGMTFKLAAMGKTGATGLPYAQMHSEAQWIFNTATQYDEIELKWDLGEAPHSSLQGRRLGLHETSIVEEINRRLLGDDAVEDMLSDTSLIEEFADDSLEWVDLDHGRNLGRCTMSNKCGNRCFGRCGPGCTCWAWVCGDCGCWGSCRDHDYFCSCIGWWNTFCIAAAWAIYC